MKCKFVIALVAAIAPLALCQNVLLGAQNPWMNQINQIEGISSSDSQAQAQAQAQAQSSSMQSGLVSVNGAQLQNYLGSLHGINGIGAMPGVSVLNGVGLPGAASAIPAFNPYAAQDAVAESLAETALAHRIRNNAVDVVPPNLSTQAVHQSVHVPVQGRYINRVFATQQLPPMIVSQPDSPTVQISSGPAAVVRAAPVIYRQPPSVVLQNEVINRHPAPLSLNPVYVKVYKPGKKVIAPRPIGALPAF